MPIIASLENKVGDKITWNEATGTWVENEGTWENPELGAVLESKNSAISASLEDKNVPKYDDGTKWDDGTTYDPIGYAASLENKN